MSYQYLKQASQYDDLDSTQIDIELASQKQIIVQKLSCFQIDNNQANQKVSLINFLPALVNKRVFGSTCDLANKISGLNSDSKFRVRTPGRIPIWLNLEDIMSLWMDPFTRIHSTDICASKSMSHQLFNYDVINGHNLFSLGSTRVKQLQMLGMTVSTKGSITCSHTDDADSIIYGLAGKKLWLVWDYKEGSVKGLEDGERLMANRKPNFSMAQFLALNSSRWAIVEKDQMLFLPGKMTHRVVTLEDSIGLNCFRLSLPNLLNTLIRWMNYQPLFIKRSGVNMGDQILTEILKITLKQILKLKGASKLRQQEWGLDCFELAKIDLLSQHSLIDLVSLFPKYAQADFGKIMNA